jgi:hypothetical protein
MVASWRASCGGHISPIRTATRSCIRRSSGAIPAANATESMPIVYPEGSSRLSYPACSAASAMSRQCSQLDCSRTSGTPRNS